MSEQKLVSAPIPQGARSQSDYETQLLPMTEIFADHEFNCRGQILPMDVIDLARDIKKDGLQSPVTVQPWTQIPGKKYRLVAGYRRFTAFLINKESKIPAMIKSGMTDLDARRWNLKENLIRKELNIMQEAKGIAPFIGCGMTEEEIAKEFEQSRGWVQIRKWALQLPAPIQEEIAVGLLRSDHIKRLARLKTFDEQYALVRQIKDHALRGEKLNLPKEVRKIAPGDRKHRNPTEIYAMNEYIIKMLDGSFATRYASWCAGYISDLEFAADIKEECETNGVEYFPHDNVRHVMS